MQIIVALSANIRVENCSVALLILQSAIHFNASQETLIYLHSCQTVSQDRTRLKPTKQSLKETMRIDFKALDMPFGFLEIRA